MKKGKAILHGVSALCSVLVFAFFALPFYTIKVAPAQLATVAKAAGVPVGNTNGYQFLETALRESNGSALATFTAMMALFTLIVAGVVLVAAIFALLTDFAVIKNQKVATIANWVVLCVTVLLAVFAILNLIGNACFVANDLPDRLADAKAGLAYYGASLKIVAGWALTIIVSVLSLGAAGTSIAAKFQK